MPLDFALLLAMLDDNMHAACQVQLQEINISTMSWTSQGRQPDHQRQPRAFPPLVYGTAWKEERTQPLVAAALNEGFRAIDTANQRRHYDEEAVGQAIQEAIAQRIVSRQELFLQTKFTFRAGQDHRLPYDPKASISVQVEQSFASSLEHLDVGYVDSYLLHGPSQRSGLSAVDWDAWQAMEAIHDNGRATFLGVSNVTALQLDELCASARVQPTFVQNRCYASRGWDADVRTICRQRGIIYQGFSLLTANPGVMASNFVRELASRYGCSSAQIIFGFAMQIGILPLTGTTSIDHMRADLKSIDLTLDHADLVGIERVAAT